MGVRITMSPPIDAIRAVGPALVTSLRLGVLIPRLQIITVGGIDRGEAPARQGFDHDRRACGGSGAEPS